MTAEKLTYEEMEAKLGEAQEIVGALRHHEVDAIVGDRDIAVVRLREAEEALHRAQAELEERIAEQTAALAEVDRQLQETLQRQKEIQQQLEWSARESREHAELLDLAHDMIFVHDMDGRIVFWNRGAELTYGWKREEAVGRLSHEMLNTEFAEPLLRITARIIQEGWWEGELVQTTRDGRQVTVAARWALRRDADGRPVAILEIDDDITLCKRQQRVIEADKEQLDSLTEELVTIEERQRRQIAQALHDSVGQSLAFSKRELNLLRQGGPEEVRGRLEAVCAQLDDAIRYTRDLTFELSPSTLHTLGLQAALEELADQFAESEGFHCQVEGPGDCAPLNEQVRSLLYRAVRELLVNVAKHAEARNVRIVLDRNEQGFRIAVQDDGKGFDVSVLQERRQSGGFGMLSVRERLIRIGGALAVESEQGKGTKVTVIVPMTRGQRLDWGLDGISAWNRGPEP
jgi:PAS domain S-box-containing protein